jgi:hypothetical protein
MRKRKGNKKIINREQISRYLGYFQNNQKTVIMEISGISLPASSEYFLLEFPPSTRGYAKRNSKLKEQGKTKNVESRETTSSARYLQKASTTLVRRRLRTINSSSKKIC